MKKSAGARGISAKFNRISKTALLKPYNIFLRQMISEKKC